LLDGSELEQTLSKPVFVYYALTYLTGPWCATAQG